MNPLDFLKIAPEILPLLPRVEKAVDTIRRLENDPDLQDLLALVKEFSQILEKSGIKV